MNLDLLRRDIEAVAQSVLGRRVSVIPMPRLNRMMQDGTALLVSEALFVYPTPVLRASGWREELALDRLILGPAEIGEVEPVGGPDKTFVLVPEAIAAVVAELARDEAQRAAEFEEMTRFYGQAGLADEPPELSGR